MIDPFVLLAPVLLLVIMALFRFVGCAAVLGLDEVQYIPTKPTVTGLSPTSEVVCQEFDLIIFGTDFAQGSQIWWDGGAVKAPTVQIPGGLAARILSVENNRLGPGQTPRIVKVAVRSGGENSSELDFTINPGADNNVTFANLPQRCPGVTKTLDPLIGACVNLQFPNGQWLWEVFQQTNPIGTSNIRFASPVPSSTFGFANGPRILKSVTVFFPAVSSSSLTLQLRDPDGNNPQPSPSQQIPSSPFAGPFTRFTHPTNWTRGSRNVQVSSNDEVRIVTVTYLGPP